MSRPSAPTVVLVHGAWADGSSWSEVIALLQAKELRVVSVQNQLNSLAHDTATVRRVVERQQGPVVLGTGLRLFDGTTDKKPLHLVDTRKIGDGLVHHTYEFAPASPAKSL